MTNNFEPVKFGTDGWRAVIADTYTFENVQRVSLATARVFKNHSKLKNGVFIGYDTRFLSKEFANCSAEVLANEGIKVFLADSFVTTPTVSLITRDFNLAFGVMITASHNPYQYNGFKLKDEFGGSMNPDELIKVEKEIINIKNVIIKKSFERSLIDNNIELIDGRKIYIDNLKKKIDIKKILKSSLNVIYDAMFGAGQNTISSFLKVKEIRGEQNPLFGGGAPEPVPKNLINTCEIIKKGNFDIGIINDGDADRIAIINEKGEFVDAQKTFALLLKYLHQHKKWEGKVVRGYSTSELIKKYCEKYNLEIVTVPIGFKHISKIMIEDNVLIGAEESGGIGIKGHLPERDGVYNGLLYLEMLANTGKKISELIKELENEFGRYYYKRIDVHTTDDKKFSTLNICKNKKIGEKIGGREIIDIGNLDGYKFSFDTGWLIIRASGTEPLLRFYCETYEKDNTDEILKLTINNFNLD